MRKRYDFAHAQPSPYAKRIKKQITLRLDEDVLAYFRALAKDVGLPYQTLINLYLRDCAEGKKKLKMSWKA